MAPKSPPAAGCAVPAAGPKAKEGWAAAAGAPNAPNAGLAAAGCPKAPAWVVVVAPNPPNAGCEVAGAPKPARVARTFTYYRLRMNSHSGYMGNFWFIPTQKDIL